MQRPQDEHKLFHSGIERLLAYSSDTKPEEHRWEGAGGMKEIIDSFSKPLNDHLYAEIDVFLGLKNLESVGLRKRWDEGEEIAKRSGSIGMMVRLSADR